jgi:RNA polymerase sigma factor (TIGR02999 family)
LGNRDSRSLAHGDFLHVSPRPIDKAQKCKRAFHVPQLVREILPGRKYPLRMSEVTQILAAVERGEAHAAEKLLPLVYDELRKLAAARMAAEAPGQTLQATALVHEAYVRLVGAGQAQQWNTRGHFFGAAAEAMRRILIERARGKMREKRGGDWHRVDFEALDVGTSLQPDQLVALDDALARLATLDPLAGELVKLRYFAGLALDEAAAALGISTATAYRHWAYARAWLHGELLN